MKEGTYGYYLTSKAYNARVLCEWLMDTFVQINARPEAFPNLVPDPRAHVAEYTLTFGRNQNCSSMNVQQPRVLGWITRAVRNSGGAFVATST